jgi:hypothetical protein
MTLPALSSCLGLVKKLGFVFGSSEDKAGKEAQHQKRSAQRSAFLVLG